MCRDERAAERLIDYTRTRAHAIAENPLIIEPLDPPTLPSSPPMLVLSVCFFLLLLALFYPLPLSFHVACLSFPNIFGNFLFDLEKDEI